MIVVSLIKMRRCFPEIGEKMPPISAYFTICGLAVILIFDLLMSDSNHCIFVPDCTEIVNLVKFAQTVYKIAC